MRARAIVDAVRDHREQSDQVRWHDLECGGYAADLPLWRTLAAERADHDLRVLDVGCGTGRVALDLARAGHRVLAFDVEPAFRDEVRRRAAAPGLPVDAVVGDMSEPPVGDERFGLVVVPMQTLQLLPDEGARIAALGALRACLGPGGRLAVAIVEDVEPFGPDEAELIAPDMRDHGGTVYASRPTEVVVDGGSVVLRRTREIVEPDGRRRTSRDEITLRALSSSRLVAEAARVGLDRTALHVIDPTGDHAGTTVVVLGA
ncbi:MAG: class I SAM-dependent methyltransferase [Solirubrobacteraceae bacterium]|nr:class I SAM-dependent methyltransferase [Solirubrobacteraceae bacterium]